MNALQNLLEREIDLISRFLSCMFEEQQALKNAQPESLPAIHGAKAALVEQLNAQESERVKMLGGPPHIPDRERMNAWLQANPAEEQIAHRWKNLLGLARQAKQQNELNATLVKLHLDRTTQALAILTRRTEEATLYGSNGQAAFYTGSRIVDSA